VYVCALGEYVWAVRDLLTELCEFCLEVVRAFDPTDVIVVGLLSHTHTHTHTQNCDHVYVIFLIILTFRIVAIFMLL